MTFRRELQFSILLLSTGLIGLVVVGILASRVLIGLRNKPGSPPSYAHNLPAAGWTLDWVGRTPLTKRELPAVAKVLRRLSCAPTLELYAERFNRGASNDHQEPRPRGFRGKGRDDAGRAA